MEPRNQRKARRDALESSGNELAGYSTFPGGRGRVGGRQRRANISGQCPGFLGTEPKAHPARSRAAQGILVTPTAVLANGAGSGGAGNGLQINLPMADGGRQTDARLRVLILAQPAKLLGKAAGSRQVNFAIAKPW